jgi:hypothetical protein
MNSFVPLELALSVPRCRKARGRRLKIYALYDQDDRRVRYVGKTSHALEHRLRWHHREPTNARMAEWLRAARVGIAILEHVGDNEWEAAERGWIYWFRERGELLNVDPGGEHRDRDGRPKGQFVGTFEPPQAATQPAPRSIRSGSYWERARLPMPKVSISPRKGPVAGHGAGGTRTGDPG